MGNAPLIGFKLPSRDNSPIMIYRSTLGDFICPEAVKTPIASVKSYAEPSLRMSAGDIFMMIFLPGIRKPLFSSAAAIRKLLSLMALSGRPTKWYPIPLSTLTSTVMVWASTPKTALP